MPLKALSLLSFRNHIDMNISADSKCVLIVGKNGSGKTNILEAISLLTPGKGIRGCSFEEMACNQNNNSQWAVNAKYQFEDQLMKITTYYDNTQKRIIKIDDNNLKRHLDVLDYVRVVWLTPQMDGIFLESRTTRRKFFDRLVYNFFSLSL